MPGGGLEFSCEKPRERNAAEDPEHVLKALQNIDGTEDKLAALCKKYTELLDEHKSMQTQLKQNQRVLSVLSREKDQLQSEHSKAVLAKSKLEGLCRELQRHNKLVKDESVARGKEDEEKRKEITSKFQSTINDIQQQMNEHYQKNTALREENLELANKLKGLIEQYELREQHIDKVFKSKDIETQLYDARLQQAALEIGEAKEKHLQDKQLLMQEAMESQKKIILLEEQEKALKAQVSMYSEKYDDFQSTLTRSNDVFTSFKSEMEKMSKKIKKLERDSAMWKTKWESSQKSLLTVAEQKASSDKTASLLQNKLSKLESLCRALQEERKLMLGGVASSERGGASEGAENKQQSVSSDIPPSTDQVNEDKDQPKHQDQSSTPSMVDTKTSPNHFSSSSSGNTPMSSTSPQASPQHTTPPPDLSASHPSDLSSSSPNTATTDTSTSDASTGGSSIASVSHVPDTVVPSTDGHLQTDNGPSTAHSDPQSDNGPSTAHNDPQSDNGPSTAHSDPQSDASAESVGKQDPDKMSSTEIRDSGSTADTPAAAAGTG